MNWYDDWITYIKPRLINIANFPNQSYLHYNHGQRKKGAEWIGFVD